MFRVPSRGLARVIGALGIAALVSAACGGTAAPSPATTAATAAPSVAATAAPSPTLKPVTLKVSHPDGGAHMPLFYARDKGIFAKYAITVELQALGGGAPSTAALIAGQTDIADTSGSTVLSAVAGGADLVVTGVLSPSYPYVLMASPDIKVAADLKGKTIVVKAIGDATDVATRLMIKKLGLVPDKDVTILAVNQDNARIAAVQSKQACCTPAQPQDRIALEDLGFKVAFDMSTLGLLNSQGSITAKRDWLAANKDVMQRFIDAVIAATAAAKKDKPGSIEVLKKQLDIKDDKIAGIVYDFFIGGLVPVYPTPAAEQFTDAKGLLGETNAKVAALDVTKIIDASYVKSAQDRGVGK
jgi:NitT/TauT family transport system substrate-binding protein